MDVGDDMIVPTDEAKREDASDLPAGRGRRAVGHDRRPPLGSVHERGRAVSRARVVVIGAGVVGANVAYRLAQAGAEVIVVDAGAPGGGTSGASFAWVNSFWKEPRDYYDLNVAGMAEHGRLAEELGGGAWRRQVGNLNWEEEPEAHARLRETGRAARRVGLCAGVAPPRRGLRDGAGAGHR